MAALFLELRLLTVQLLHIVMPCLHVVCVYCHRSAMVWYMALELRRSVTSLQWVTMKHQCSWSHSRPSSQVSDCSVGGHVYRYLTAVWVAKFTGIW